MTNGTEISIIIHNNSDICTTEFLHNVMVTYARLTFSLVNNAGVQSAHTL